MTALAKTHGGGNPNHDDAGRFASGGSRHDGLHRATLAGGGSGLIAVHTRRDDAANTHTTTISHGSQKHTITDIGGPDHARIRAHLEGFAAGMKATLTPTPPASPETTAAPMRAGEQTDVSPYHRYMQAADKFSAKSLQHQDKARAEYSKGTAAGNAVGNHHVNAATAYGRAAGTIRRGLTTGGGTVRATEVARHAADARAHAKLAAGATQAKVHKAAVTKAQG